MNRKKYVATREKLIKEAKDLLDDGKIEEARAKKKEVEDLDAGYQAAAEARADLNALQNVALAMPVESGNHEIDTVPTVEDCGASSEAYKRAWLKNMARDPKTGEFKLGGLTPEEKNAFTFTTANTDDVVPTEIQNRIIELVESMAPMYDDSVKGNMTKGFGIPRHTAIAAGDAATTNEGVANVDEEDTFDLLELTGVEIKKHVKITRKMEFQSIDAFETYITRHLAERIAVAKETRIRSQLDNATYGIDSNYVLTNQTYAEATIRTIFGMLKGQGIKHVYANNKTIWGGLYGIQDDNKRPIFIPDQTADPTVAGTIYGARVRQDENLADNVAYFGIPTKLLTNDFDNLTMSNFMNPETFVKTIGAYSLFDAGLENPMSWVKVTFTPGE